jgi:ferritin-like metal-binding protein YciE
MPAAKTLNERDTKLVRWLGEAHAKEAELEADLTAHIALTQKQSYKKRLQQHLKETRDHKRRVAARIKQLGGPTGQGLLGATGSAVGEVAGKTVAAVKGQVGAARALVTDQAETHLRNAEEELREEQVEIAIYSRIEVFATEVGDRDTAQLARAIRREDERMAKYLQTELGRLVKDVIRTEIPRDQRPTASRSRSRRAATTARSRSRATASSNRARTTSRSAASRGTGTRSTASRAAGSRTTAPRSAASRSSSPRSASSRNSSSRSTSSSRSASSRGSSPRSTSSGGSSSRGTSSRGSSRTPSSRAAARS